MADKEIAIKVSGVGKTFQPQSSSGTIKEAFISLGRKIKGSNAPLRHQGEYTALKDISFEVNKGDFFGIVGRNGCGKSTLLKILAGVYTPSKGTVQVNGKLTPFIELGVGFNPELSGRDNVFLNGSLLGFTRKQMEEMYDDIVDFAELHDFMDTKLKNYSSGMQVRLAFSVAIRAESDILIIDEVLAVGDEAFQQKCLRVFEEYKESSRTVILVTHDMNNVRSLCNKAMLINEGTVKFTGDVNKVADLYSDTNVNKPAGIVEQAKKQETPIKKKPSMKISTLNNKKIYKPSEELVLDITLLKPIQNNQYMGVAIHDSHGAYIFGSNTKGNNPDGLVVRHTISLDIGPGKYYINTAILSLSGKLVELDEKLLNFTIIDDNNPNAGGNSRLRFEYKALKST